MTDEFDSDDSRNQAIKRDLMRGIALKDIATTAEVNRMLEAVGFQVVEGTNLAAVKDSPTMPWYQPMETQSRAVVNAFYQTPLGRKAFIGASRLAEALGLFPKGSAKVVQMLNETANAYVAAGKAGIFTPLYCFLARKPFTGP